MSVIGAVSADLDVKHSLRPLSHIHLTTYHWHWQIASRVQLTGWVRKPGAHDAHFSTTTGRPGVTIKSLIQLTFHHGAVLPDSGCRYIRLVILQALATIAAMAWHDFGLGAHHNSAQSLGFWDPKATWPIMA